MGHEDKRQDSVDTAAMQGDAPAQALARARQMAHRASQREDAPRPRRGPSADYVILDEAQQFMADDEPRDPEPHVPETFQPKRHGRPLGEGWKAQGADVERVRMTEHDGRRDDA